MTRRISWAVSLFLSALSIAAQGAEVSAKDAPVYSADGGLVAPAQYREWVFLTSGIDMAYAAADATAPEHSIFDNVFVNPAAYRSFLKTGTWPNKTTMVLEIRAAEDPVSINKRGHTQSTAISGIEIHVKDHGQWNFYDLSGNSKVAKLIARPASCYICHEAHGAAETTFVQFYPTLLPLAKKLKTLSPEYLKEMPTAVPVAPQPAT